MNLKDYGLVPHECATVKPGMRFGRLVVLATGKPPNSYRYKAVCQCDCGSNPFTLRNDALTSGVQVSCGCFHRENHLKHGLSLHPLFNVHKKMIGRCADPQNKSFHRYGARGITVCERWLKVENFVADMEATYHPGLTIERIDNDLGYCPENCKWATYSEQADNRSTGRYITFNGKTQSLNRWAKEMGINEGTLRSRLDDSGWSIEQALTAPTLTASESGKIGLRSRWGDKRG